MEGERESMWSGRSVAIVGILIVTVAVIGGIVLYQPSAKTVVAPVAVPEPAVVPLSPEPVVSEKKETRPVCVLDDCSAVGMGVVTAVDGMTVTYDFIPAHAADDADMDKGRRLTVTDEVRGDFLSNDYPGFGKRDVAAPVLARGDRLFIMQVAADGTPRRVIIHRPEDRADS